MRVFSSAQSDGKSEFLDPTSPRGKFAKTRTSSSNAVRIELLRSSGGHGDSYARCILSFALLLGRCHRPRSAAPGPACRGTGAIPARKSRHRAPQQHPLAYPPHLPPSQQHPSSLLLSPPFPPSQASRQAVQRTVPTPQSAALASPWAQSHACGRCSHLLFEQASYVPLACCCTHVCTRESARRDGDACERAEVHSYVRRAVVACAVFLRILEL